MDYLPIFIDVRGRPCLVVGGGDVALRKVELLHAAGAEVHVVAPELCAELALLARRARLPIARRRYASRDLRGAALVIAATDDMQVNARVAAEARARGVPVNVVDQPKLCSFIMPAIIDRSPVLVAVSTSGASPSLARLTRSRLEAALPPRLGRLAVFAAQHRELVKRAVEDMGARRLFWDRVLDGDIAELVLGGREREAATALRRLLARGSAAGATFVALIAAGEGDPERLPLGALRWLGRADRIVYEPRVPAAVLGLARRDAQRVPLGRLGRGERAVERFLAEAAAHAQEGSPLCLLRAGNPYGVRRPAAEVAGLRRAGIGFAVFRPAP